MDDVRKLKTRRAELLKQICEAPLWVKGSVVETTRKVRDKVIPFYYLSHSVKGKNRITYISASHLEKFRAAAAMGTHIKLLQTELSSINMKLIKRGCLDD